MNRATPRLLILAGLISISSSAQAHYCPIDQVISVINSQHNTTRSEVVRQVNTNTNEVVTEAAKAIIKTFTMETAKQKNSIVTSVMFGAQATRNTMLFIDTARTKRDMEAPPAACVTSDVPLAALNARASSESFARAEMMKLMDDIGAASAASSDVVMRNTANRKRNYGAIGNFAALHLGGSDTSAAVGAATFNNAQVEDARTYIRDLFAQVRISSGNTPEARGKAISERSALSVIASAFTDDLARKSPVDSIGKSLKSGGFAGLLNSDVGRSLINASGGMSWNGLLTADVDRRYMDPEWTTEVSGLSSPVSLGKEQVFMMATSLKVQLETLKALRKIEQQMAVNSLLQMQGGQGGGRPSPAEIERALSGFGG